MRPDTARHSLTLPVGQDYLDDWARLLRQPEAAAEVLDQAGLAFRIGAEWLMLPTSMVDSVAPSAPSHALPHRRGGGLAGIVNVGGAVVPAIALDTLLGIDGSGGAAASGRHVFARLVVARVDGQRFAMPVADLHGIVRYPGARLQAPAATINRGLQRYLAGVLAHEDMMIGVLDAGLVGQQMTRLLR
jgi:chemotaxis-related protein WspD